MSYKNFFKKKFEIPENVLIINIDDFSIESAILSFGKDENSWSFSNFESEVFNSIDFGIDAKQNAGVLLQRTMFKLIEKAANFKKIGLCLITFSSIWNSSQTHLVRARRDNSFIFTEKDFDDILKNENSLFVSRLKNSFNADYFKFTEAEIMKVLLNGYEITSLNPFQKKIKSIEMSLYMSALNKDIFDFTANLVKSRLRLSISDKNLIIKSRPFVFFTGLEGYYNEKDGFILMDIQSESSEIILIKDGLIEETVRFNKGEIFFIRRVKDVLNISFYEAKNLFIRHNTNDVQEISRQKFKKTLDVAEAEWNSSFVLAIREINKNHFLPKNFLIYSKIPFSPLIFAMKDTSGNSMFNVKEISLPNALGVEENSRENLFMQIEAKFINNYLKN